MFSEKATKNLNLDLSFTGNHQIKDVKCLFCGILRKHEFYLVHVNVVKLTHSAHQTFKMVSLEQGVFLLICSIHCVFKQKKSKKHNLLYFKFAKRSFQETHFAFLSRDERNENVLCKLDKHPV